MLFGIVLLAKFYNVADLAVYKRLAGKKNLIFYLFMAAVFILLNSLTIRIFKTMDYNKYSDIIPIIQMINKRLLSGLNPYDAHAMEPFYYQGPTNYLPMHWLPFSIAEYFHFDYRSISFIVWCLGALFVTLRSARAKNFVMPAIVLSLLTGAYLLMVVQSPGIMGVTVEMMIAGYYLLFIAGINVKNGILIGFFTCLCLLSRYYVALWIPLWIFILFISGNRRKLFYALCSIGFFVLIIYVIPFLSKDWSVATHSMVHYENVPFHEWINAGPGQRPGHLYNGTGFAYLFYEKYVNSNLFDGYQLLKKTFFLALISCVLLLGAWYTFNKNKINYHIFILASFKIYLSVFLSLIMVPYIYLMITGIFVSIAIFAEQAAYFTNRKQPAEQVQLTKG